MYYIFLYYIILLPVKDMFGVVGARCGRYGT